MTGESSYTSHCPIQFSATKAADSRAIVLVTEKSEAAFSGNPLAKNWARHHDFTGKSGQILAVPAADGELSQLLFGYDDGEDPFITGKLSQALPGGHWHFENLPENATPLFLGLALGAYRFNRYRKAEAQAAVQFYVPESIDIAAFQREIDATFLVRDLINTPANDMGPDAIEHAIRQLGRRFGAEVNSICGDDLLQKNFPLIHAVGRAGAIAPRLVDLRWGQDNHPLVTLVGKGVAFDTGGLDIKSASGMLLMKKDMGGAANVMGLAQLIMDAKLPVRLRVLIPAVENAISGNAFRPGDVLQSRKGLTVEVGNTDAEGRLVLADALSYGDEEKPQYLFDMATLTGAARVALGPDLPPFYSNVQGLADKIAATALRVADPLWQMPLWKPYQAKLASRIADINNVTTDGFAGSITAALFLSRFVEKAAHWAHFDIYGWTPVEKPGFPIGGEAQGIRTLFHVLKGL